MGNEQKIFVLRVDVTSNNIQTSMKTQNVTPQEVIGYLEMAKDQKTYFSEMAESIRHLRLDRPQGK